MTQAALASLPGVEPISVSRRIDRMERQAWVRCEAHQDDRRVRIVLGTGKAREVAPTVRAIVETDYGEALTVWTMQTGACFRLHFGRSVKPSGPVHRNPFQR